VHLSERSKVTDRLSASPASIRSQVTADLSVTLAGSPSVISKVRVALAALKPMPSDDVKILALFQRGSTHEV
jgi:hypothetical protein